MTDDLGGWRPLSQELADIVDDETLHEGIPEWMREDFFAVFARMLMADTGLATEIVQRFRLRNIRKIGQDRAEAVFDLAQRDDVFAIDCVNLALARTEFGLAPPYDPVVDELEEHLARSGSALRAVRRDGLARLEERVPADVQDRAETVMAPGGVAGRHLRNAWGALYGRDPNLREAVDEAVMAMENVLCDLACPADADATLGRALGQMRNEPDRFKYALDAPRRGGDPDDAVVALADVVGSVWATQQRHSTGDGPAGYEPEQAEAAVHVAMTVVHVVREGLLSVA